jgi:putative ABC transport system permease protein
MRPSWRLALQTLAGWRARSLLLVTAVMLAAGMAAAVSSVMASVQGYMTQRLHRVFGAVNARVVHEFSGRFDESLLEKVRAWPEVEMAAGRLFGTLTVVRADGAPDPATGRPHRLTVSARGIDLAVDERFQQIEIAEGSRPQLPHEIVTDPIAKARLGLKIGDRITVQRFGPPIELEVVGFYGRPMMNFLQQAGIQMDRGTLGAATNQQGRVSMISMIVRKEVDPVAFCRAHADEVPKPLALEPAEMSRAGFDRQIRANRTAFLIATVIGFLSCCFIVTTGLTTAVVEQQRLLAIMRCLGGERRHLFMSQIWVGLLLCGAGGLLGMPVGLALAWALIHALVPVDDMSLVVSGMGLALALGGALLAGLLGATYPAWEASRVSPLAALTVRARPPRPRGFSACLAGGLACILIQLALFQLPDKQIRFWAYAFAGLPLLYLGYFFLAVPVQRAIVRVASGLVARLCRIPRALLLETMLATPYRHGFTAGSLMVGMAILVNTWSNGLSILDDWFGRIRFADGFVGRVNHISPQEQEAIAALPFITDVCPIGYLSMPVVGEQLFGVRGIGPDRVICVGFDPDTFFRMNRLDWIAGDPATAIPRLKQGDAILVAEQFLTARAAKLGGTLTLGGERTNHTFEIVGVVNSAGLDIATQFFGIRDQYMQQATNAVFMDSAAVARHFDNRDVTFLQVNLSSEISDEAAAAAISEAAPGARFASSRTIRSFVEEVGGALLTVSSAIAFAALVLASFGVGNIILAGIHSRRYEYGVLRALGASPGVLGRLIAGEAILVGLGGAAVGLGLGMHLAWIGVAIYRDLAGLPLKLIVPTWPASAGAAVLIAMCVLSALPGILHIVRKPARVLLAVGRAG